MTPAVDVSDLRELEGTLRGRIYLCNSQRYDQARQVWNGMIDKRPLDGVGVPRRIRVDHLMTTTAQQVR
jgi:hypothetical protein